MVQRDTRMIEAGWNDGVLDGVPNYMMVHLHLPEPTVSSILALLGLLAGAVVG